MKAFSFAIQVQKPDGSFGTPFGECPTEGTASDLIAWYKKDGTIEQNAVAQVVKIEKRGSRYRWH